MIDVKSGGNPGLFERLTQRKIAGELPWEPFIEPEVSREIVHAMRAAGFCEEAIFQIRACTR